MSIVCHIVTSSNDPSRGGMEETTDRIARSLAASDDLTVIVYTSDPACVQPEEKRYQIEDLSEERCFFEAPLTEGGQSRASAGRFQVSRLLLRTRIESVLANKPNDRHVLISFFLTKFGFTAQLISQELAVPHIACIAGSDLNRDVASPSGMAAAVFVMEHADWIVVRSREQAQRIEKLFNRSHGISVYHGGLPEGRPRGIWRRTASQHVSLISDCGYSFKKSTQTLVDAFGRLLNDQYPVTLTIVGPTQKDEQAYWDAAKREWGNHFRGRASFCEQVSKDKLECMLLHGDIYCSASLGEGSPNGALFALAVGMPVIAPRMSSLDDLSGLSDDRLSLFRTGSRDDFYSHLAAMVMRIQDNLKPINRERLESFRRHLSEEETRHWLKVVHTAAMA